MEASPFTSRPVVKSTESADAPSRRPSLLPAFEPLSSSPGLPRPAKRKFDDLVEARKFYPTPIPTSSTGILPSSSPARQTRPGLQRTVSTLSERAPLSDVPTLHIPYNGEPVLMGRSSNSSDYQLPGNRHVSRVHVRASYSTPDALCPAGKVEVECLGWNGATVHCRGQVVDLAKGECFMSDKPHAQIIVDVQSTRIMLAWPKEASEPTSSHSKSSWLHESPTKRHRSDDAVDLASSPPAMMPSRQYTPPSPTPNNAANTFEETFRTEISKSPVRVYEDHSSDEDAAHEYDTPGPSSDPDQTILEVADEATPKPNASQVSQNDDVSDNDDENDEENDPIVHSFGPFGDNLLSKFESFKPVSPGVARKPLGSASNSPVKSKAAPAPAPLPQMDLDPIRNHVINQLAYSRIHSLPLSTIHSNLPVELRGAKLKKSGIDKPVISPATLKTIIDGVACVGEIKREGKDAAGKLLESEFYYMPEADSDDLRRNTVTQSLGKTSMRAARKQHKQYYWKKPRV
ncbi:hypothetical protein Q7P37_011592 [Cladosporium fusiforme]